MVDLRHEPALGDHEQLSGAGDSRLQDLREGSLLRDGPWLSTNSSRVYQELIGIDWTKYLTLADKIERGDAVEDDAEHETLYESYPAILDTTIDLFNMVSRRDEEIVALKAKLEAAGL